MHLANELLRELETSDLAPNERALLRCRLAKRYEDIGDYEAASDALADLWQGIGARPNVEGLNDETKAHVLLRTGTLMGFIGSAHQIADSQEFAKDLISESARIFDGLGQKKKAAEARSDLAPCYWREGAFDEARVTLQEALDEFEETDVEQRAIVLLRLAEVERASSRLSEALRIYNQAASLFDEMNEHLLAGHFHSGRANVLNQLSTIERRRDYVDLALIEYAAASYQFEQAGHEVYQACVENNLGFLFSTVGEFEKAHEHLDRAQMLMTRCKDNAHLAQVDETRARVLLAESRNVEAEKTARSAVLRLEKGDELSLLSEALRTHGIALARLDHSEQARTSFDRAISVAEQSGDLESAGLAALTLIEQLGEKLSNEEMRATLDHAGMLIEKSEDIETVRRLVKSTFRILFSKHGVSAPPDWTNFSFKESVLRYESHLIKLALIQSGGSVTRASRLLGFGHHQSLIEILKSRHKALLTRRTPPQTRRKHLMSHPKRKQKKPN